MPAGYPVRPPGAGATPPATTPRRPEPPAAAAPHANPVGPTPVSQRRFEPPPTAAAPPPQPVGATPAGPSPHALCRAAIAVAERELTLPASLLAAIGRVESGRPDPQGGGVGPWPWTINAEGRGSFFPTKAAAIAAVRQLQADGVRSIDVGCMQVNLKHHPAAFPSLDDAFDPLTNARYAGRFLRELYGETADWNRASAGYHSRNPEFGVPYQARVQAALAAEQRNPTAPPPLSVLLAAATPPPRDRHGGFVGGMMLSNNADRAVLTASSGSGGRGLDAYRAAPISAIGRIPVTYNGPYRRL